ncbi:MAG: substrate-binding domain-containing protein [Candidatus Margulisbacteria bacterium]|nr:substrate-binding domain-containing protein [Candidatus Margulisiibacteriota bacterium]
MRKQFQVFLRLGLLFLLIALTINPLWAVRSIILATTTSTVDSGLLDALIPPFEKQTGIKVKVIGVGSGMALEMGRRGEADILLVHSPKDEEKFMAEGNGTSRRAVMHNDFVLLGPSNDPASAAASKSIGEAFKKIAAAGSLFVSRGDKSGTHAKELSLWPDADAIISNQCYIETGQGMGATLLIADQKNAYTLADRATYLSFKNRIKLVILREGDKPLLNPYHMIEVNPKRHPKVKADGAKRFADFISSPAAKKLIANFGKERFGGPIFILDYD